LRAISRFQRLCGAIFTIQPLFAFSDKVGNPERLNVCLLTYADIKAVNQKALTPWKRENVWQLYIAASNCMSRTADQRPSRVRKTRRLRAFSHGAEIAKKSNHFSKAFQALSRTYRPEEVLSTCLCPQFVTLTGPTNLVRGINGTN
jgi:UTP:GlnB (protein PII) uridylyltransferase